jgi:hypothetical protein
MPLPVSVRVEIGDHVFSGQYAGHGQSKVAFLLEGDDDNAFSHKILKLCAEQDDEPHIFERLAPTGLVPRTCSINQCQQCSSAGQPARLWHAWITERAVPLDQFVKRPRALPRNCILGAIRCMLAAACSGLWLSDNALFNFGVLHDKVVIIDAGSRGFQEQQSTKSQFNNRSMRSFFFKAAMHLDFADLADWKQTWHCAQELNEALRDFERLWSSNCVLQTLPDADASGSAARPASDEVIGSAAQPASDEVIRSAAQPALDEVITCVPHVAAILVHMTEDLMDWITRNFLWHRLADYALLKDGRIKYQEGIRLAPDVKLEMLIRITRERRVPVCTDVDTQVLTQEQFARALELWKEDWNSWMHPESIAASWLEDTPQDWHQRLRGAFRTFQFHVIGCTEMTLFFLVAPFTVENLGHFRAAWNVRELSPRERLDRSIDIVREIYALSSAVQPTSNTDQPARPKRGEPASSSHGPPPQKQGCRKFQS